MFMKTCCLTLECNINLLKEIQSTQSNIELWAYGLESSPVMGTVAFEFAIHQDLYWYEFYQRFVTLNDEEYARVHIIKHFSHPSESTSEFPFSPYERIYQSSLKKEEKSWMKVSTIRPPFSIYIFQDTLSTCNEAHNGTKIFRHKCADVAFSFESISSSIFLQITTHPYFLKLCHASEELDDMKELWEFHFTEEEELKQLRLKGSEEYFHAQCLVDYSRMKMNLSDRI